MHKLACIFIDFRCKSPINLRQREQLGQITPSSTDLSHMLFNTAQIGLDYSLC